MKKNTLPTITLLFFLLIGWPFLSYLVMSQAEEEIPEALVNPSVQLYLPTIIIESLIFLLIFLVLKREGENLKVVGFRNLTFQNILIGFVFLIFANLVLLIITKLFSVTQPAEIKYLLPRNTTDRIFWTLMSLTAGIAEETGFRGYVLTKLNLFLKNWWATVIISSFFFGIGHFYQGLGGVILTGVYGLLFCLLFIWRKSLYPGIIAHFLHDASVLFIPI